MHILHISDSVLRFYGAAPVWHGLSNSESDWLHSAKRFLSESRLYPPSNNGNLSTLSASVPIRAEKAMRCAIVIIRNCPTNNAFTRNHSPSSLQSSYLARVARIVRNCPTNKQRQRQLKYDRRASSPRMRRTRPRTSGAPLRSEDSRWTGAGSAPSCPC